MNRPSPHAGAGHICRNMLRKYRAVLRLEVEGAISSDLPIVLNIILVTLNASKEASRNSCSHAGYKCEFSRNRTTVF